jgi:hypothetical protein
MLQTLSPELHDRRTLDGPSTDGLPVSAFLFHVDDAVRIDQMKLDDDALQADGVLVVVGDRMMRP